MNRPATQPTTASPKAHPALTDAQRWALESTRANALERELAELKESSAHALHWLPLLEEDCTRLRRELDDALGVIR